MAGIGVSCDDWPLVSSGYDRDIVPGCGKCKKICVKDNVCRDLRHPRDEKEDGWLYAML